MERFTEKFVAALKPRDERYELVESGGLGIRVSGDTRTWFLSYHFGGRRRRMTLGHYPLTTLKEARERATAGKRHIDAGRDPADAAKTHREAPTVADLIESYMASAQWDLLAAGTRRNRKRALSRLKPIHSVKVLEVRRSHLRELLHPLEKRRTSTEAQNSIRAWSVLFSFAMDRDWREFNPCVKMKADGYTLVRKKRVLSDDEIRTVWTELPKAEISLSAQRILMLELLTMQRVGAIGLMRKDDLDHANKVWAARPESTKGGSRTGQVIHTPLCATAWSLVEEGLKLSGDSEFVFPSPSTGVALNSSSVGNSLRNWIRDLGLKPFTSHDLRRTVATRLAEAEVERGEIRKILAHADHDAASHYIVATHIAAKRRHLERWEQLLMTILSSGLN